MQTCSKDQVGCFPGQVAGGGRFVLAEWGRMFWKFQVFFLTVWHLPQAYFLLSNPRKIRITELGRHRLPVPHAVMARKAGKFVRFFVVGKKNLCVLHSLTLFKLLRRYGLDLQLNISVPTHTYGPSRRKERGHSWLTLAGKPYFDTAEDTDMEQMELIGISEQGINYWVSKT